MGRVIYNKIKGKLVILEMWEFFSFGRCQKKPIWFWKNEIFEPKCDVDGRDTSLLSSRFTLQGLSLSSTSFTWLWIGQKIAKITTVSTSRTLHRLARENLFTTSHPKLFSDFKFQTICDSEIKEEMVFFMKMLLYFDLLSKCFHK